mgnify:CR=1 FL=1
MKLVFLIAACCSVLAVALICIFLFMNGVPAIFKIGPLKFLTGTVWKPGNNIFGILPMIVGSICVTGLAILMGVPVAILTSVFLSRYCPKKFYGICKSGINLMAGIPSIVYGFFGLVVIVPLMAQLTGKNRKHNADGIHSFGRYDSSDRGRCNRIRHYECSGILL